MPGKNKTVQIPAELHAQVGKLALEAGMPTAIYIRVVLTSAVKNSLPPKQ